ncbi:helix-turn-helix domain-containing protein [Halarsenatibacter silvermanii]|uniref:HTH cro/C1-type domain-containing protein n=1 Tax=Halarsenatibacter silvermanii TaxID=321763 RepID=A0A1G9LLI2_9FIRM|nr:helix-turn-helix domain-containing protein [Halarsenatibacter silvermanii]SDL62832.1 protein of unknown function [Halarsenatibacter silvermanii]
MAPGKRLKEKREELGLSIEDIEENTKIRKKYIIALENDNYEEIPGLVYARAFIKNYSSFLGLDEEEILEEFDRWRHLEDVDDELEGSRRRIKRSRQDSDEGVISRFFSFSPRVLLAAFILVLIAGGVTYNLVIMNGNGDMEAEPDDIPAVIEEEEEPEDIEEVDEETEDLTLEDELVMQELEQYQIDLEEDFNGDMSEVELENGFDEEMDEFDYEAISEPEVEEIDLQEDEELEELVEDPDAEEVPDDELEAIDDENAETETEEEPEEIASEVEIIITERAWLSISVDGENVFEGILEAGEEEIYEPENSFEIRTGNAGGVELTVAGEEMGTMGETGEVVEEEFEL